MRAKCPSVEGKPFLQEAKIVKTRVLKVEIIRNETIFLTVLYQKELIFFTEKFNIASIRKPDLTPVCLYSLWVNMSVLEIFFLARGWSHYNLQRGRSRGPPRPSQSHPKLEKRSLSFLNFVQMSLLFWWCLKALMRNGRTWGWTSEYAFDIIVLISSKMCFHVCNTTLMNLHSSTLINPHSLILRDSTT